MSKQNDIDQITTLLESQVLENLFNVYLDESGSYYYNTTRSVYFPDELDANSYTEYTTSPKDTWPLISYRQYGSVKLWWIICIVNEIVNPVAQPDTGIVLKILNSDIVIDILESIRTE